MNLQEELLCCSRSGLTPIGDLVLVVVCIVAVIAFSVLINNLVAWRKRRRTRNTITASSENPPPNREKWVSPGNNLNQFPGAQ